MKTAISLPDELFRRADALAGHLRISRSRLYARALDACQRAQRRDDVTEALNRIYAEESSEVDAQLTRMQRKSLPKGGW